MIVLDWLGNLLRRQTSGQRPRQATRRVDRLRATMAARAGWATAGRGEDLLTLGTLATDGEPLPVSLTRAETRQHAIVLGATGTGKSVLLTGLIGQILERRLDESVILLDPHGAMDEPVLRLAAAAGARVVHLDLSGHGPVVTPFNPLGGLAGLTVDERAAVAHRAFSSAYAPGQGGGFIDATLRTVMYLLACCRPDDFSLAQAEPLLLEPGLAERVLSRHGVPNPSVVSYLRQLRTLGPRAAYSQTRYAFSRIDALLAAPGARATFCGRGTLDLAEFLRMPGVLVISAPRAVLGEAAAPTLAWLLELVVHVLMRRSLPCRDPHVTIVVDEVMSVGTHLPALSAMLAELRKFGVSLWGSLQSLSQSSDRRLVDEFVSNSGLKVLFGLSPTDAGRFCDLLALPTPARPRFDVGNGYTIAGGKAGFVERGRERDRTEIAAFERALRDVPRRLFHLGLTLEGVPVTARLEALPKVEIPCARPRLLHARSLEQVQRELMRQTATALALPGPTGPAGGAGTGAVGRGAGRRGEQGRGGQRGGLNQV